MPTKLPDKTSGSTLRKAVKNVKQLLKEEDVTEEKKPTQTIKKGRPSTWNRGLIYIGHIPHGFFEEQMRDYFSQFGKVTRVRLVRSRRTGKSRGYGYVEFLHADVAQIAAETMNNYLMEGRLLKASYIPPEKQHLGYFAGNQWTPTDYPLLRNRKEEVRLHNTNVNKKTYTKLAKKTINHLSAIEKKLQARGINFKIQPVDVPELVQTENKEKLRSKKLGVKKTSVSVSKTSEVKKLKKVTKRLDEKSADAKKLKSKMIEELRSINNSSAKQKKLQARGTGFKIQPVDVPELVQMNKKETLPSTKIGVKQISSVTFPKFSEVKTLKKASKSLDGKTVEVKKLKSEKVEKVKRLKPTTKRLDVKTGKLKKLKKSDESTKISLVKKMKKIGSKKVS